MENTLNNFRKSNILNVLALRGNIPVDPDFKFPNPLHNEYAKDLISHIREMKNFSIGVAAYSEGHIECKNQVTRIVSLYGAYLPNKIIRIIEKYEHNT